MSLIRYSVYGHRQPASPLVFWGRFVVGSWCAGHGGLVGRVYDSVWTEAYRCTGELELIERHGKVWYRSDDACNEIAEYGTVCR